MGVIATQSVVFVIVFGAETASANCASCVLRQNEIARRATAFLDNVCFFAAFWACRDRRFPTVLHGDMALGTERLVEGEADNRPELGFLAARTAKTGNFRESA